jgi:hypothetical protein
VFCSLFAFTVQPDLSFKSPSSTILILKNFMFSLIPAFSPRRRRIVRHRLENSRDWIGWTVIRKKRNVRWLFLFPRGEGQDEGG